MGTGFDKYLKASNKRPAQKLRDGTTVIATNTVHGPTQSRCMSCHGMCGPAKSADGKDIMRCSSCGNTYTTKKY